MAGAHRAKRAPRRRWAAVPTGFRNVRDALSYVLGAGLLLHQTLVADSISWEVIAAAMALIGAPFALGFGDRDTN